MARKKQVDSDDSSSDDAQPSGSSSMVQQPSGYQPSQSNPQPTAGGKPGMSKWVLALIIGIVALVAGLLVGYGSGSSQSQNLCIYGIPNKTNSSQLDAVDAYKIVLINASYGEINVTPSFCNMTSLSAQQSAFVNNALNN